MNKNKMFLLVMAASTAGNLAFSGNNAYAKNINQEETYGNIKLATNSNKKGKVINVHTNLRIRKEPNTHCTILGHLKNGEEFKITGKTGEWYAMEYNGIKGYVHGDYVKANITNSTKISQKVTENKENNSIINKKGYIVNIVTNLRVRQNPSTNSEILGYLRNGQEVNIKEKIGKWYSIEVNGHLGYVYGDYIKEGEKINNKNIKQLSENKTSINNNIAGRFGQIVNVNTALRVRKAPSSNSDILGYLKKGDTLQINSKNGQWYNVTVGEKSGYVHHAYVQLSSNNSISNDKQVKSNNDSISNSEQAKSNNNKEIKKDNTNKNIHIQNKNKSETINLNYSKESEKLIENKSGIVSNVSTNLRLRNGTSTDSTTLAYLLPKENFKIIAKSGDWYKINYKGRVGYVHNNYVKIVDSSTIIEKKANSNINKNNKEKNETKNSNKIEKNESKNTNKIEKSKNTENNVKENSNNKKNSNQNKNKENSNKTEITNKVVNNNTKENNASFNKVYSIMKTQLGSPYIYGGSGQQITQSLLDSFKGTFSSHASRGFYKIDSKYINNGYKAFDCSGLMQWAFNQVGISLGRSTYDQVNAGVEVSKNNAKPGDLLFYKDLGHVGMYIGNGQWIEAPNKGKTVRVASVPWSSIGKVRRVL